MSSDANKFPVSFEMFKRCIYYDKIVETIIRHKTSGNPEKLKLYLNSKTMRERTLRLYYEAFYTKPAIRTEMPIKIKPLPKTVIERLLQFPNDNNNNESGKSIDNLPPATKETSCKFCQVSLEDFKTLSNVLELVPADDDQGLRYIYFRFMQLDEAIANKLRIKARLMGTMLKCREVCTACEQKWISHSVANNEGGCEAPETGGTVTTTSDVLAKVCNQICSANIQDSCARTETYIDNADTLRMVLRHDTWYSAFYDVFLKKLAEPYDYSQFPVTFNVFKQCSMHVETLNQIICDICDSKEDLANKLKEHNDFCESLTLYYYRKYFTCPYIRTKYPLKLKMCPGSLREKMLAFVKVNEGGSPEQETNNEEVHPTDIVDVVCHSNPDNQSPTSYLNSNDETRLIIDEVHPSDTADVVPEAVPDNQLPILHLDSDKTRCSIDEVHSTNKVDVVPQANPVNQSPILYMDSDGKRRCNVDKVTDRGYATTIKVEPDQMFPLRRLKFVEHSDGELEAISFEEDIVDVNNSYEIQLSNESENLPPQILFDEGKIYSQPQANLDKFSGELISSGSSGSSFHLAQRLPTFSHLNESHHESSESDQSVFPCFPIQNDIEMSEEKLKGLENAVPMDENIGARPILSGIDKVPPIVRTLSELKSTNKGVQFTKKTQKIVKQSVKKTDVVPLLPHAFRPLPLGASTFATNSNVNDKNRNLRSSPQIIFSTQGELPVTSVQDKSPAGVELINNSADNHMTSQPRSFVSSQSISPNFEHAVTSTQAQSTLQSDDSPKHLLVKPLRISQELLKDCTIFNDSSLIRAADQINRSVRISSKAECDGKCPEVANTDSCPKTTALIKPQTVGKSTSDLVHNFKLPFISKRFLLYYNLLGFDYFEELNSKHVSDYQLTTTNYGSTYMQATISCGDFKTKLINENLAALGFTAERNPNFFTILKDLGEFHYSIAQNVDFNKECDLRKRVLFCYINSMQPFCFAQLEYNEHNTEFSKCKEIKHLGMSDVPLRNPYKRLTNAIDTNILLKMEKLKNESRNK